MEDNWIECVNCRNFCTVSVFCKKTSASTAVESYCERKTGRCRRGARKFSELILRLVKFICFKILCAYDIFSILMRILFYYFE
jgi:hypothetical protein